MKADGSDQTRLTNDPALEESPDWQPLPDRDGDGVLDGSDDCPSTADPAQADADGSGGGDACDGDDDDDGLPDAEERSHGTSRVDRDSDDDGLSDRREVRTGSDPRRGDTDGDLLRDGVELRVTRPVTDPPGRARGTDPARFRADADPSTGTNARERDSDGDGLCDGCEDRNRNGRLDPGETDPRRPDPHPGGVVAPRRRIPRIR
jgi:hypothetical protein